MEDDGREVRARRTLEGSGAFITGSTAGIGAAVARTLAAAGARVVICGRDAFVGSSSGARAHRGDR